MIGIKQKRNCQYNLLKMLFKKPSKFTQSCAYTVVFNRKKRLNQGKALVQIRAYLNESYRHISTGIYLRLDEWDDRKKVVKSKHPNHHLLNLEIRNQITKLQLFELSYKQKNGFFLLKDFDIYLNDEHRMTFTQFILKELESSTTKKSTTKARRVIYNKLNSFGGDIRFDEITLNSNLFWNMLIISSCQQKYKSH